MEFNFKKGNASIANTKKNINAFQPIELTEGNVEAIFNRCLKTDKTVKEEVVALSDIGDGVANGTYFAFDEDAVHANKKSMKYLIGQLKAAYSQEYTFNIGDLIVRYDNKIWTESEKVLAMVCCLGQLSRTTSQLYIDGSSYTIRTLNSNITPTLSPRDPNFPAWWEAHKAEWEG